MRSWLQLSIENSLTASLFCDCSSRVDEAAAVDRVVSVLSFVVSRLGQPVLQRAHGDVRETLFDQRRDAGSGRSGHAGARCEGVCGRARCCASGCAQYKVKDEAGRCKGTGGHCGN